MKAVILMLPLLLLIAGCVRDFQESGEAAFVPVPSEVPPPPEILEPVANDSGSFVSEEPAVMEDNFSSAEELHWTHLPVTYSIQNEEDCGDYEVRKIGRAFDAISSATGSKVYFGKVKAEGDIVFRCSFIEDCYKLVTDIDDDAGLVYYYELICGHNKGLATTRILGNKILGSEIEMFGLAGFSETSGRGTSGFYIGSCGHPTTEIHEILHAFGYGHSDDNSSIMYYAEDAVGTVVQEAGSCVGKRKEIDADIVDSLVKTYGRQLE